MGNQILKSDDPLSFDFLVADRDTTPMWRGGFSEVHDERREARGTFLILSAS